MVWNLYSRFTTQWFDNMLKLMDAEDNTQNSSMDQLKKLGSTPLSELDQMRFKSELASAARNKYISDLSHDLRTPLNAILGFTQMMESEVLGKMGNPQYKEYLRHIKESGYQLLDLLEDLLETPYQQPSYQHNAQAKSAGKKAAPLARKLAKEKELA